LNGRKGHKAKTPPYTHREIGRAMFQSLDNKFSITTRLKIEAYTLFFEVLPHVITLAIWALIAVAFYGAVTLI
jgi:hypothetical protein